MPRGDLIKIRRGTAAQWTAANSILADGELGLETDTHKIKAGDGSTVWISLPYISSGGGGGGIVSGQYYDNSFQGTASSTLAGAANRIDLAPYYTSVTFSIDTIGCSVSTAVAGSLFKIVIYSTNSSGWPDTLLYESGDLSGATATFVGASLSFTFQSGVQYWVGVRHSSTCTLRTINVSSAVNLGLTSSTAANYATILRRTLTYATPATSPWNFTNSDRVANVTPPSIRFRAV